LELAVQNDAQVLATIAESAPKVRKTTVGTSVPLPTVTSVPVAAELALALGLEESRAAVLALVLALGAVLVLVLGPRITRRPSSTSATKISRRTRLCSVVFRMGDR
jgi:shikimate kinase